VLYEPQSLARLFKASAIEPLVSILHSSWRSGESFRFLFLVLMFSPATQNRLASHLSTLKHSRVPKDLTEIQIRKLLEATRNKRELAIIEVLYGTGSNMGTNLKPMSIIEGHNFSRI